MADDKLRCPLCGEVEYTRSWRFVLHLAGEHRSQQLAAYAVESGDVTPPRIRRALLAATNVLLVVAVLLAVAVVVLAVNLSAVARTVLQ